jgi:hypothetical protein
MAALFLSSFPSSSSCSISAAGPPSEREVAENPADARDLEVYCETLRAMTISETITGDELRFLVHMRMYVHIYLFSQLFYK